MLDNITIDWGSWALQNLPGYLLLLAVFYFIGRMHAAKRGRDQAHKKRIMHRWIIAGLVIVCLMAFQSFLRPLVEMQRQEQKLNKVPLLMPSSENKIPLIPPHKQSNHEH